MIRRTATKNVVDTKGAGCPELCDGAPWTQEPATELAEWTPKGVRALRACFRLVSRVGA